MSPTHASRIASGQPDRPPDRCPAEKPTVRRCFAGRAGILPIRAVYIPDLKRRPLANLAWRGAFLMRPYSGVPRNASRTLLSRIRIYIPSHQEPGRARSSRYAAPEIVPTILVGGPGRVRTSRGAADLQGISGPAAADPGARRTPPQRNGEVLHRRADRSPAVHDQARVSSGAGSCPRMLSSLNPVCWGDRSEGTEQVRAVRAEPAPYGTGFIVRFTFYRQTFEARFCSNSFAAEARSAGTLAASAAIGENRLVGDCSNAVR